MRKNMMALCFCILALGDGRVSAQDIVGDALKRQSQAVCWKKAGAKPEQFRLDSYQCKKDAGAFGLTVEITQLGQFMDCMEAHGWKFRDDCPEPAK
jgi:hypothetical protein